MGVGGRLSVTNQNNEVISYKLNFTLWANKYIDASNAHITCSFAEVGKLEFGKVSSYDNKMTGYCVLFDLPEDESIAGEQTVTIYLPKGVVVNVTVNLIWQGDYTTGTGWDAELLDYEIINP